MVRPALSGFVLACLPLAGVAAGQEVPAPRDVEIAAPDGVRLKATYFAAARPGPAVLLLHMCNTDRRSWEPLGPQLAAAGLHALALDYRGYGESGGERFEDDARKQQAVVAGKWPGDVDAALAWLGAQPGVDGSRLGAAGGSCGVNQAIQVARRHPDVARALVLLAGGTNGAGVQFLRKNAWLPLFTAAAADDQYGADFVPLMRWLAELTGNPRNRFLGFPDGRHGTEIFGPHPELPRQIVEWWVDTLVRAPADPKAEVPPPRSATARFWAALDEPGGVSRAVEIFREARKSDPNAFLFPEALVNQAAYERIAAGAAREAIELCRLNTEAYPASANAYDSLADAYLADGQTEAAMQAAHMAILKLPGDASSAERKALVRQSAERKLKLPAGPEWVAQASGTEATLIGVWGSDPAGVIAVGAEGTVLRFDGKSWTRVPLDSKPHLTGVWGTSLANLFVSGDGGVMLRHDGSTWTPMPTGATTNLDAVWGSSDRDVFAVSDEGGLILHYDGTQWSRMTSGTTTALFGVWGSGPADVFAVGMEGTILRYDGRAWTALASGVSEVLLGVWGSSASDVFAVGANGTILHYDGRTWTPMASGTRATLVRLWGSGPRDVFASGMDGTIAHYDGSSWKPMASGASGPLYGVWGASGGPVFVVGRGGTILRHR